MGGPKKQEYPEDNAARSTVIAATMLEVSACKLGESPRWDGTHWWWVDAVAGEVWRGNSDAGWVAEPFWLPGGRVSAVQPTGDGGVLAVTRETLTALDGSGQVRWEIPLLLFPGEIANDAVTAPDGTVWVGTVTADRGPSGALLRIGLAGEITRFGTGSRLSNGLAWTGPSGLLHADSLARVVTARRFEEPGKLVAGAPLSLTFPAGALPDGIALDREGGLWVALYGAGEARRFLGDRHTHTVSIPTAQCTAVALGGADGNTLLITTAQEGFSAADLVRDPTAGRLFTAPAPAPGAPADLARVSPNEFQM